MKKPVLLVLMMFLVPSLVKAQYYSVNVDRETISAMTAAFETEAAQELFSRNNIAEILKNYEAAGVATAGIYYTKSQDRKALTNITPWITSEENYYYHRIYHIVSQRIIPKTIDVVQLMVRDPATAIYWGSYILKTCDEVKLLCQTFESVVSNGRLSFQDIGFLELKNVIANVFNLQEFADINWKVFFQNLPETIRSATSKESLLADLDNLINKGVGLATAGMEDLYQQSGLNTDMQNGLPDIARTITSLATLYDQYKDNPGKALLEHFGDEINASDIFDLSEYNMTAWMTDLSAIGNSQYYTQKFWIGRKNNGTSEVCDYSPSTYNISSSGEWIICEDINSGEEPQYMAQAYENSCKIAGWNREKVDALNALNNGETYVFSSRLETIPITSNGSTVAIAFAYSVNVTVTYNKDEVLEEEVFDSYSMDYDTFLQMMQAKLEEYNNNDEGKVYELNADAKKYYESADERKLQASDLAVISVTCSDEYSLGSGSTSYKCDKCKNNLTDHAKTCSMMTTIEESDINVNALEDSISVLQARYNELLSQIEILELRNSEILRVLSNETLTEEQVETLQAEYAENRSSINALTEQKNQIASQIREYNAAIDEAEEGEAVVTDDYKRIPYYMETMRSAYGLVWQDEGSWNGNTFERHATMGSLESSIITFSATLTLQRKAKYFMGIKIHRAIIQIDWSCKSNSTYSQIVETIELDKSMETEAQAELVDAAISEVQKNYPSCEVSVDYRRKDGEDIQDSDDTVHLLWASDRLKVAQEVESRLAVIYGELVVIHKYLHYKYTITRWWADLSNRLMPINRGQRATAAEEALHRWITNSGSNKYADNGD